MAGVIGVSVLVLAFLCGVGAPRAETIRFAVSGTDNKTFIGTLDERKRVAAFLTKLLRPGAAR